MQHHPLICWPGLNPLQLAHLYPCPSMCPRSPLLLQAGVRQGFSRHLGAHHERGGAFGFESQLCCFGMSTSSVGWQRVFAASRAASAPITIMVGCAALVAWGTRYSAYAHIARGNTEADPACSTAHPLPARSHHMALHSTLFLCADHCPQRVPGHRDWRCKPPQGHHHGQRAGGR